MTRLGVFVNIYRLIVILIKIMCGAFNLVLNIAARFFPLINKSVNHNEKPHQRKRQKLLIIRAA